MMYSQYPHRTETGRGEGRTALGSPNPRGESTCLMGTGGQRGGGYSPGPASGNKLLGEAPGTGREDEAKR